MIGIGILIGLIIAFIVFWLYNDMLISIVEDYFYDNDYLNEKGLYYYLKKKEESK